MIRGVIVFPYTPKYEEMQEFYAKGLGIEGKEEGPCWTAFQMDRSTFALHSLEGEATEAHAGWQLDFLTDDIEADLERFRAAGAEILREVQDEAFGRSAVFRDPEGRMVSLVQHG